MRRELVDLSGRDADPGRLASLAAFIEADSDQAPATDGLRLSVGLTNDGDEPCPLLNPFALIQFQLRDERGFPVAIPTPPPELLIHRASGERWTVTDDPLPVVAVRINGQPGEPSSLNTDVVTVDAGGDYLVAFAVLRLDGGAHLPAGSYTVRCILTLIDAEKRQTSRILQGEEIAVRLDD